MKVELGKDVMEEPKSFPLSAQRSQLPTRDYHPTFCERKRYQFVLEPTVQFYKMEESRDISYIIRNFTMVLELGYGIVITMETPRSIKNQKVY